MDQLGMLPVGTKFVPHTELSGALAAFAGMPWNMQAAQSGGVPGYNGVGGWGGSGQASNGFSPAPSQQPVQSGGDIPQAPIFEFPKIDIPAPAPLPTPVFNIQAPPQPQQQQQAPPPQQQQAPPPYLIQGAPVPTNMQTHQPGALTPGTNTWLGPGGRGLDMGGGVPNALTYGRI